MENYYYNKPNPWQMLAYLFLIQLFIAFTARSIAPLGLKIGEDLQLTMSQVGILPAALFLGQSIISMPAGILTDKAGSKKILLMIILGLSGSFFLLSFSSSFMLILFFIFLAGFGYGASHPATNQGVNDWFNSKRRGTAMGIKQMGVTAGSALSALLLLPAASQFGWRTAVFIPAISLLVIGIILYLAYKEPKSPASSLTRRKPVSLPKLLTHPGLLLVTLSAMLLTASQTILNTFIVIFAYDYLQISIMLAGVLLGIAEFGGALGRLTWGILSDRLFAGKRIIVLLLISLLVAVVSFITSLLPQNTPFHLMAVIVFIFGFGASGFNGVWMNATSEIAPQSYAGTATGASITLSSWGAILFPPVFGILIDWTGLYSIGWNFVTLLMVISILSLLFVKES
ncbi:MFS transporter [Evansella clarkii]|uniref:MFS transporter n=1 Tax=Evansella clarkii TaxID=79879 RepID=UPI000996A3A6|nr:MFS transporter [Evansella clarkii]